jgi:hypothetical protein
LGEELLKFNVREYRMKSVVVNDTLSERQTRNGNKRKFEDSPKKANVKSKKTNKNQAKQNKLLSNKNNKEKLQENKKDGDYPYNNNVILLLLLINSQSKTQSCRPATKMTP